MNPLIRASLFPATTSALLAVGASCGGSLGDVAEARDDAGTAEAVAAPLDAAVLGRCEPTAWCLVAPPKPSLSLNSVWGSGPDDVWIVASPDMTMHWDGQRMTLGTLGTPQTAVAVSGGNQAGLWAAVGASLWQRHDAGDAGWSESEALSLRTVFSLRVSDAQGLWAVGRPIYYQSDGDSTAPNYYGPNVFRGQISPIGRLRWVDVPTSPYVQGTYDDGVVFRSVWAGTDSSVWLVGEGGKTRYTSLWKGARTSWNAVNANTSVDLYAVWGSSGDVVWAAGEAGTVLRMASGAGPEVGVVRVPFPQETLLQSLFGFGPDDIWTVGLGGTIAHWNGQQWELAAVPDGTDDLYSVWGSSPDDLWAVGRNTLLHRGSRLLPGTVQRKVVP